MITLTEKPHGYVQVDNVEACVTIGGDELVATGSVVLNVFGESYDVWIHQIRHDPNGPIWPLYRLTVQGEDDVHDALAEAAQDYVKEYYA